MNGKKKEYTQICAGKLKYVNFFESIILKVENFNIIDTLSFFFFKSKEVGRTFVEKNF